MSRSISSHHLSSLTQSSSLGSSLGVTKKTSPAPLKLANASKTTAPSVNVIDSVFHLVGNVIGGVLTGIGNLLGGLLDLLFGSSKTGSNVPPQESNSPSTSTANNPNSTKRIALIDNIQIKDTDEQASHGEEMKAIIRYFNPDSDIIDYDLSLDPANNGVNTVNTADINILLTQLLTDIKTAKANGNPIDAVNISQSLSGFYSDYDIPIGEVQDNRAKIRSQLSRSAERTLALLEDITAEGVPVFIGAGNTPKLNPTTGQKEEYFNILTLAQGVTAVGTQRSDGSIDDDYMDNDEIDQRRQYQTTLMPYNGKVGVDVDRDGDVDQVINRPSTQPYEHSEGSSHATAFATGKYVQKNG